MLGGIVGEPPDLGKQRAPDATAQVSRELGVRQDSAGWCMVVQLGGLADLLFHRQGNGFGKAIPPFAGK